MLVVPSLAVAFLAFLQISAVVLNLIPLPPFDGFGAIEPYLSGAIRGALAQTRGMLPFLVFFLLWYIPAVNDAFWSAVLSLSHWVGIPLQLVQLGFSSFQFWNR